MATNGSQNIPTGASGTVLQGQGAGVALALSTATYPATAGTSANVLTSDGTNWTSAKPVINISAMSIITGASGATFNDATVYATTNTGNFTTVNPAALATSFLIPVTGTIRRITFMCKNSSTLSSNENYTVSIRVNNTASTSIASTMTNDAIVNSITNSNLNLAVSQNDYFAFIFTTPTWGTNPGAGGATWAYSMDIEPS